MSSYCLCDIKRLSVAEGREFDPSVPPPGTVCLKTVLTDPWLFPREQNQGRGPRVRVPLAPAASLVTPVAGTGMLAAHARAAEMAP
jgi:hypothetical protein